jgi:uncharacterized protein with FMN-binding domain
MPDSKLKRTALPLALAAAGAGSVLAASPALAAPSTTYKGATESYRWGTIQVSVVVKNKKITNVKSVYVPHTGRSQFIEDNAVPVLKQEVLQAQSISIDTVSGATDTSYAYASSLQSAVQKAVKAKALATKALA